MNTSQTGWDPGQYLKFGDHRLRPGLELLGRIDCPAPRRIYDLGCGTGALTRALATRWPQAAVIGVDRSQEMLDQAQAAPSPVQWQQADLRCWRPDSPPDILYSNATLHWIEGHREFFPRLLSQLTPGGTLAVQMPLSWDLPSHRLMRDVLATGDGTCGPLGDEALRLSVGRKWVEDAAFYYDLLTSVSDRIDIWETEYLQILTGDDPVLEWVKGTGLRPVLDGLDEVQGALFLTEYRQRLRQAYPRRADGSTLYPFRRLFIVAASREAP